jgi:hypothetical protein
MTTNALIFKSTVYPEWYVPPPPICTQTKTRIRRFTDRLAPWVHYVPIQIDYSDLYDALVFFRGDLAGRGAHEDLAARIAREGREWSLKFWRKEDMTAYLFRCVSCVPALRSLLFMDAAAFLYHPFILFLF